MRTNIVIDDKLMKEAMRASGAKSKREAVDYALKLVVRVAGQERLLRETKGKLHWDGDLQEMRRLLREVLQPAPQPRRRRVRSSAYSRPPPDEALV